MTGLTTTNPGTRDFRATMARFAKCVTVTTTMGSHGPVGCTTTGVLSLSADPPAMLVSLASTGRTVRDLVTSGAFCLNVLSCDQHRLVRQFAGGDPDRRFDGVGYHLRGGVPVLDGTSATVVCRLSESFTALDHTLLIGAVEHAQSAGDAPLVLLDGDVCAAVAFPPQ